MLITLTKKLWNTFFEKQWFIDICIEILIFPKQVKLQVM